MLPLFYIIFNRTNVPRHKDVTEKIVTEQIYDADSKIFYNVVDVNNSSPCYKLKAV